MQKIDTTQDKILLQHDPTKKKIMECLAKQKEHIPISVLSKKTGIQRERMYHHINMLEDRKMLKSVIVKKARYVVVTDYGKKLAMRVKG